MPRLESDRPCNNKNCNAKLFFDPDAGKWRCKKGHIQEAYGTKSGVKGI